MPNSRFRHMLMAAIVMTLLNAGALAAQSADPPAPNDAHQMHGMQHMDMSRDADAMPPARDASGTAWQPDDTPMYAIHHAAGGWMLMAHGNAFLQYLHESGRRGSDQVDSVNWLMGMASRPLGAGRLTLHGMVSLEPWTVAGCGYPDLLASGEVCRGNAIHDRQHPHDLFMEIAATYDRPLAGGVRLQLYGGPAGEPALGPVAFPHRLSAMANPLAPIAHHWFDATHITYGVATAGVYRGRWKGEASVFNGREPDEHRTTLDFGALDSWSARLWFLPTARWALQVSGGRLKEAEAALDGSPRIDVDRLTATATYQVTSAAGLVWASTVGWGRNAEHEGQATDALLAETSLMRHDRHVWFGRFEAARKSGHDLAIEVDPLDLFTVAKLQGGYTRYFDAWSGWRPGVGATISTGIVPESLTSIYGSRANVGVGIFLTLRPAMSAM